MGTQFVLLISAECVAYGPFDSMEEAWTLGPTLHWPDQEERAAAVLRKDFEVVPLRPPTSHRTGGHLDRFFKGRPVDRSVVVHYMYDDLEVVVARSAAGGFVPFIWNDREGTWDEVSPEELLQWKSLGYELFLQASKQLGGG